MDRIRDLLEQVLEAITPVLRVVETEANQLFSDTLSTLSGVSLVLLALTACLVIYALGRRVLTQRRRRNLAVLHGFWMELVAHYLEGDGAVAPLMLLSASRHRGEFVRLVGRYLLDLAGEDRRRLEQLLKEMGYDAYLRRMLFGRNEEDRAFAANLLGLMRDVDAIPFLRQRLKDRSMFVRFTAASALMRIRDEGAIFLIFRLIGHNPRDRQRIRFLLYEFGPQILPLLEPMLLDPSLEPWNVITVLEVFGHFAHTGRSTEMLVLATTNPQREVRVAAVKALSALDDPVLRGIFEDLLDDEDPVVQAYAAKALGSIGGPDAPARLAHQLRKTDFWVVKSATEALISLGQPGEDALQAARLQGLSPMVDALVTEALTTG